MIRCKTCGKDLGESPYRYSIYSYQVRTLDATPDGTAMILTQDAGTFCSDECMLRYLAQKLGKEVHDGNQAD